MTELAPFHMTVPVHDLDATRAFYGTLLGCREGGSGRDWIVFDFYGHQLVTNHDPDMQLEPPKMGSNGYDVPVPHFGAVLTMEEWQRIADRLRGAGTTFLIEPQVSTNEKKGEQATMFLLDPSGNAVELKAMRDRTKLFD